MRSILFHLLHTERILHRSFLRQLRHLEALRRRPHRSVRLLAPLGAPVPTGASDVHDGLRPPACRPQHLQIKSSKRVFIASEMDGAQYEV